MDKREQLAWERRHFVLCCVLSLVIVVPLLLVITQGAR